MKHKFFVAFMSKSQSIFILFVTFLYIMLAGYCYEVSLPSVNQLTEFKNIGPVRTSVDINSLVHIEDGQTAFWPEYSASCPVLTYLFGDAKNKNMRKTQET